MINSTPPVISFTCNLPMSSTKRTKGFNIDNILSHSYSIKKTRIKAKLCFVTSVQMNAETKPSKVRFRANNFIWNLRISSYNYNCSSGEHNISSVFLNSADKIKQTQG